MGLDPTQPVSFSEEMTQTRTEGRPPEDAVGGERAQETPALLTPRPLSPASSTGRKADCGRRRPCGGASRQHQRVGAAAHNTGAYGRRKARVNIHSPGLEPARAASRKDEPAWA